MPSYQWWKRLTERQHFYSGIGSPRDLLVWMEGVTYGWLDGGRVREDFGEDDKDFTERYRLLPPNVVYTRKVGVCQDQALFEWDVLQGLGYECHIIFVQ
jgi:hypothetical protein